MPTFQEYLDSIKTPQQHYQLRLSLMQQIEKKTKRRLIVYTSNIHRSLPDASNAIDSSDITGFSDLIEGLEGSPLDIFIHSPGGSAEATEQIVRFLRSNFKSIRFIIPHTAMSAATMMCLSGNSILMDDRSALGPIDPQIRIPTQGGPVWFPAQIILDGFARAQEAIVKDPKTLPLFLPWLNQYGPYVQAAEEAMELSKELATDWLTKYMFPDKKGSKKIGNIVKYLSNHKLHKSHGRRIGIDQALAEGLKIEDLRRNKDLRTLIWNLYCVIELFFDRSASVKMFENSSGVKWSRQVIQQQIAIPLSPVSPLAPAQAPKPKP